ncbi:uncharacterized protein [Rutidosis leptorrhynchoides]|uniref:uncharacterized protein n=1 Tax=Rutidosis leptorrhynchoides TaxID=125765 RepID=UPI003A99142C
MEKDRIKSGMLRQKARVCWALEGDENTKFFHSLLRNKYNKSNIRGLNINGIWNEDPNDIKASVFEHFKHIYEETDTLRPSLEDLSYPSISAIEAEALEVPILEDEIHEAILECGSSKAPGPDGFNMRFFKKFWDIIKIQLIEAINWFWDTGEISKGCNASFVTLVPKKLVPGGLGDFRPISLIGSYYKIVAKILSNRLQKILPSLVSSGKSAFLKGRFILDGVLIANETIDYLKASRKKGIIFKVDFEKAFDSLNWQFLFEVMKSMGFGRKWVKWIESCLKSASISVLVNGSPTNEFVLGRGVRQEVNRLARHIGCNGGKLPFIYLGLTIGSKMTKVKDWNPVIEKFKARLSSWKMRSLSFGGRVVLIKSVLNSLPLYYFSLFRAPPSVLKILESVRRGLSLEVLQVPFKGSFIKTIGDGNTTLFWKEHWIGNDKLCKTYPRLYRLELDQNTCVKQRVRANEEGLSFTWNWARTPSGRTEAELHSMQELLASFDFKNNKSDNWKWAFESSGLFSVRKLTSLIDIHLLGQYVSQPGTVRNNLVPKKVEVFIWRALKKRLPVKIELDKRGIDLHSVRCPLCDDDLETVEHALYTCKEVEEIWIRVFKWWNVSPYVYSNIANMLGGSNSPLMSKVGEQLWQAIRWISAYLIWKNRNNMV